MQDSISQDLLWLRQEVASGEQAEGTLTSIVGAAFLKDLDLFLFSDCRKVEHFYHLSSCSLLIQIQSCRLSSYNLNTRFYSSFPRLISPISSEHFYSYSCLQSSLSSSRKGSFSTSWYRQVSYLHSWMTRAGGYMGCICGEGAQEKGGAVLDCMLKLTAVIQRSIQLQSAVLIILLMSLLTSPHTTRDQHRFFNKMEREFNKKSFVNQNFVQAPNPFESANQNTERAREQLQQLMDRFLSELKGIYQAANDVRIDFYFIMTEMKSYDFFQETANIINQTLIDKNSKLERQNNRLKQSLKKARQEIRDFTRSKPTIEKKAPTVKFNGIKSVAQNLYEKAKILNEAEFIQLCDKAILQEKIVVKKVAELPQKKSEANEEKVILSRIDSFIQKHKDGQQDLENELVSLIRDLRKQSDKKHAFSECHRPCCTVVEEKVQRSSKASALRRSSQTRKESCVYKNDKSEQYFNRYYRRSQFDMHKILNVEKTKLEQMERIQDDYRIAIKQRYRLNRSMVK